LELNLNPTKWFLPRDATCHNMSSVSLSVRLSVALVDSLDCDHSGWNS